jgi:amino acid adenylation domain-containing protein
MLTDNSASATDNSLATHAPHAERAQAAVTTLGVTSVKTGSSFVPDPRAELPFVWPGTVVEQFARRVREAPEAVCVVGARGPMTYAEVDAASDSLADAIDVHAPVSGATVSVFARRDPRLTVVLLAILKAQLSFHIIDPRYPYARIRQYLEYVAPSGIVNLCVGDGTARDLAERVRQRSPCFCIDYPYDAPELISAGSGHGATIHGLPADLASPMYVAFTSGTTGVPTAVWGGHAPVGHFFDWQSDRFAIQQGDRVSVLSGLAHDPLLRDVLMPLWCGASAWFPPDEVYRSPGALFEWLRDSRITVLHLTPSLCQLLLEIPSLHVAARELPRLRLAFFGGEALTARTVGRFLRIARNAQVVNCYGATETPQVMGFHVVESPDVAGNASAEGLHVLPIGRGIDAVQLLVLDADGKLCPAGVEGEICVRTPYRALRVEDLARRSSTRFVQSPFSMVAGDLVYRTGDYGRYGADGTVKCSGRRDRQVKIRGLRVDLAEVEEVMHACSQVAHYHVDVVQLERRLQLVLFVAPEPDVELDRDNLLRELSSRLPEFMVPDRIVVRRSLPRTPNGKVDGEALRASLAFQPGSSVPAGEHSSSDFPDIEGRLRALPLPVIDDAGTLGPMDSLTTVELSCVLEESFGVKISYDEICKCTSVVTLAQCIARHYGIARNFEAPNIAEASIDSRVTASPADTVSPAHAPLFHRRGRLLAWLPEREQPVRAFWNRILQLVARVAPDAMRVRLHRLRGVRIGEGASVGYDTIIETAFPSLVRIGSRTNIGMRVTIIGHFRGMECAREGATVVIEDDAFVGPGAIVLPNVTIGRGAVIAAGSVVSASIPPGCFAQGNPARVVARCDVPLTGTTSYADFLARLTPLAHGGPEDVARAGTRTRADSP